MFKHYRFVSSIICLLALFPFTARVASAQQMSYSFGSGQSLNWSVSTNSGTCGPYGGTLTEWTFGGFTFVDAWGDVYPLTFESAPIYISSTQTQYCPPSGPMSWPLALYMGSTVIIDFYMESGGQASLTVVNLPVKGYANPKYAVVSLMYAPPGPTSYASYANNTVVGSTTSTSSTISNQSTTSSSYIFGFEDGAKYTTNYSTSYTQATSSSSSIAMSQTSSNGVTIYGCGVGLNHLCDQFRVWLNPLLIYGVAPNTSAADWFGYGINWADQQYYPYMEVVQVQMGALENPETWPMPSGYATEFERTWAINNLDGSGPGLTQPDFNNIVAGNPFSTNYTISITPPSITTNDGRYTAVAANEVTGNLNCGQATVSYGPNTGFNCSIGYTTTATSSENATQTYTTSYGIESEFSATAWGITFGSDTKNSTTITQTTQFNQSTNNSKGQTATLVVIGYDPTKTSYNGPNEFTLWQDNLYGTFMLYP
jgi:hypothetical protein